MTRPRWLIPFRDLDLSALAEVGGKNVRVGTFARERVRALPLPADLRAEILASYERLSRSYEETETDVAVRSSATAEDLPSASFAGQQESYLNVRGADALLDAVRDCMASLFTDRAIVYRAERGFRHRDVALSVGVQKMVRSDLASAGVMFTLDTESGHRGVVTITGSWGLGESVVKGRVNPDEIWVFKPTLFDGATCPIIRRERGDKAVKLVYGPGGKSVLEEPVSASDRRALVLTDEESLLLLARLFDERDPGVKKLIEMVTRAAHAAGRKVGLCGQAPSDHPDFAEFLADIGLDSISVTADALPAVVRRLASRRELEPPRRLRRIGER